MRFQRARRDGFEEKSGIFLVRTDGHACYRESVRNAELTFDHPTSQQLMIMWKEKPRTVLVRPHTLAWRGWRYIAAIYPEGGTGGGVPGALRGGGGLPPPRPPPCGRARASRAPPRPWVRRRARGLPSRPDCARPFPAPPTPPQVIKRLGSELIQTTKDVVERLESVNGTKVVLEPLALSELRGAGYVGDAVTFAEEEKAQLSEVVDLVVCLGGDGTMLHCSHLFQGAVPPLVAFALGSLGFLTVHDYANFGEDADRILGGEHLPDACPVPEPCAACGELATAEQAALCDAADCPARSAALGLCDGGPSDEGVLVTLRMRLSVEVLREGQSTPDLRFQVMNEIVIDRGSHPHLTSIDCEMNGRHFTRVQADGLMISTPTGSTAYSLAAGGSIVHPTVPAILFTPICPHTLTFRPVILPDSADLLLTVSKDARNGARVSFDGREVCDLEQGDSLRVRMSQFPLPTINRVDHSGDWFGALQRCMMWNERVTQKQVK